MGQYYKAVKIAENEIRTVDAWSHDNGAKLMEHSYYGNKFLNAVLGLCEEDVMFRLGWVGDYSDDNYAIEMLKEDHKKNLHNIAYTAAWRDVDEDEEGRLENADRLFGDPAPMEGSITRDVWVCNTDKMQAVLHKRDPLSKIHLSPFPILCAIGNGLGGGDYHGTNMDLVGSWAYDKLFITYGGCPGGYEEISPEVFEGDY